MRIHVPAIGLLLAIAAINFLHFPGHTYLQSDTQIYAPILERLWDPGVFEKEIIARKPHVAFTMYDEATLFLRRTTGGGTREALFAQQVLFRLAALFGAYLLGLSIGQGKSAAVLVAGCFGLGATIPGPSVLTFEYEPNPRGNAVGLVILALGLVANGRHKLAGCAAGLAFLYHVPAVYPYWGAYFLCALIPGDRGAMARRIQGMIPMAAAVLGLLVLSQLQPGVSEKQQFFQTIDPTFEKALRERASYNWVSMWPPLNFQHYLLYFAAGMLAIWRIRTALSPDVRFLLVAIPSIGMLSMPASYVLLERMKWMLIPQLQPMRSVLYVIAVAVLVCCMAAIVAARAGRWWEAIAWFAIAFSPSSHTRTMRVLFDWSNPTYRGAALIVLAIAVAAWFVMRHRRWWPAVAALAIIPYWAIPAIARVRNYPPLHSRQLDELAGWARQSTPRSALFLFPDAGRALHPGVFRAQSLRTVYVDWKGGGQINFMRHFLSEWLPRWEGAMAAGFKGDIGRYAPMGIDYVVLDRKNRVAGQEPVYQNDSYVVYRILRNTVPEGVRQ